MRRRWSLRLGALTAAVGLTFPLVLTSTSGCGGGGGSSSTGTGGDAGPIGETVTLHPSAPPLTGQSECTVVIVTGIPVTAATHVPVCTSVSYATNPPSGGNHWPVWAAYSKFTSAVPREMYVHNLEHGGLVLAYHADPADEADVVAALTEVFDGFTDPLCVQQGGVPARLVLTPDAKLTTPIAIAGWGATYTATCIDKASLNDFIVKNAGHGTEAVCANGQDPTLIAATCLSDGGATTSAGTGGAGGAGGAGGHGGSGG